MLRAPLRPESTLCISEAPWPGCPQSSRLRGEACVLAWLLLFAEFSQPHFSAQLGLVSGPRCGSSQAGKFRWVCSGRPSLTNNVAHKTGAWWQVSEDTFWPISRRGKGRTVLGEKVEGQASPLIRPRGQSEGKKAFLPGAQAGCPGLSRS